MSRHSPPSLTTIVVVPSSLRLKRNSWRLSAGRVGGRQARAASGAWFTASGKPKRRDGTYSVAARRKASKLSAERLDAMLRSV